MRCLITHAHADHIFGLDDIRPFNFRQGEIPVFASESTWRMLRAGLPLHLSPIQKLQLEAALPMIQQEVDRRAVRGDRTSRDPLSGHSRPDWR
jgi:phosphoribosyl 1,2-cyclic phosphate phosphodiesterase